MKQQAPWKLPASYGDLSCSYDEALGLLAATHRLGVSPLLETVVAMLEELGRPDGAFRVIQIAGTNGKTSTARYTAAILLGEGYRTALYTSPELVFMTERMELLGKPVAKKAFAHGVAVAVRAGERVNKERVRHGLAPYDVTEFDLLTVAALVIFAEAAMEVAVLEVGLGGRWDATSATTPELTCVSGIGLDHTQVLGTSLEAIAAEKAAIIKPGQQACVLGPGSVSEPAVAATLLERARACAVPVVAVVPQGWDEAMAPWLPPRQTRYSLLHEPFFLGDRLGLEVATPQWRYSGLYAQKPSYQAQNIACAVTLAQTFCGRVLNEEALRRSVAACPTPGRFEVVRPKPLALVDACHNPQSIQAFLSSLKAIAPEVEERPALLFGVFADKQVEEMVKLVAREFPVVYVTQTASLRALAAPLLAKQFEAQGVLPQAIFTTVDEACCALARTPFVALGTITLAGEVSNWYRFHS